MNKKVFGLLAVVALLPATASAGEVIFGVKAGLFKPDISDFDPTASISGQIGYEFLNLGVADIAAEVELSKTITDGEVEESGQTFDYSGQTAGAYVSARTLGPVYGIARIGVVKSELDIEGFEVDDTGVSVGAGIGFSLGVRTEVEATQYELDDENIYYVSLGFAF